MTVWDRLYDFFRDQGSVIAGFLAVGAAYYAIRATKDAAKRQVDAAEDSTARQVVAMEKQLQEMREARELAEIHAREVERAYVSGGGCRAMWRTSDGLVETTTPSNLFEVHVNNHGKTPANIHHARYGFFDAAKTPPTEAPLGGFYVLTDRIAPGRQSQRIGLVEIEPEFDRTAVCGRIYWNDIWDVERSNGFVYEISDKTATNNSSISLDTPKTYWDERDESDKPWEAGDKPLPAIGVRW